MLGYDGRIINNFNLRTVSSIGLHTVEKGKRKGLYQGMAKGFKKALYCIDKISIIMAFVVGLIIGGSWKLYEFCGDLCQLIP